MTNGQGLTDFHQTSSLIFQLLYHNLYQVQHKNADEDCKLAVETLQESCSESVLIEVALFSLSMFRYSLHSSTRQNILSHCFYSPVFRPSRNNCFNTPQNKISISRPVKSHALHVTHAIGSFHTLTRKPGLLSRVHFCSCLEPGYGQQFYKYQRS